MSNGNPGKKIPSKTRERALELLQSHTVDQVCQRLGVSKSVIRNWQRDAREAAAADG